jgi:hypothetical protein
MSAIRCSCTLGTLDIAQQHHALTTAATVSTYSSDITVTHAPRARLGRMFCAGCLASKATVAMPLLCTGPAASHECTAGMDEVLLTEAGWNIHARSMRALHGREVPDHRAPTCSLSKFENCQFSDFDSHPPIPATHAVCANLHWHVPITAHSNNSIAMIIE